MFEKLVGVLVVSVILLFLPSSVSAATLEVPFQYSTIQSAINAAQTGDVINVAAGTYHEVINFNEKSISIIGADKDTTTIDGSGLSESVVTSTWECIDCTETQEYPILLQHGPMQLLKNFTISGGNSLYRGGGIQIRNASPRLNNLIIRNNTAPRGGGIYIEGSGYFVLENSLIENNESFLGGGIFVSASKPTVKDTIINQNIAQIGSALLSSGALGIYSNILIENHTSLGNTVTFYYGNAPEFAASDASPLILENSKIIGNSATDSVPIQVGPGQKVEMRNTQLTENSGVGSGAIQFVGQSWYKSYLTLDGMTISNNITEPYSGNGQSVGAIWNDSEERELDPGTITIKNSILWNNGGNSELQSPDTSFDPSDPYIPAQQLVSYSIIDGGYSQGVGILDADPLFVDSANGDYHLTSNSPAIDSGDPNNPPDPDSSRADMGAYPFFHQPLPTEQLNNLINLVQSFNLQQGIQNSLDTKLQNAYDSLNAENIGNRQDAINKLRAFISAVQAQSGNKLTVSQANILVQDALIVIDNLN